MYKTIKNFFYFPAASYFRFWAGIRVAIWRPRIIVITGTSGKTMLLHLVESQLKNRAKYSHFANSSFGIPFDILGLRRKKLTLDEWFYLFTQAPLNMLKKFPKQKIYVVEADCDRPFEGKFLANLLKPEVTLWVGTGIAHSMNFDRKHPLLLGKGGVEQAIAYEYGYFLETTKSLTIVNGDNDLIKQQLKRTKTLVKTVNQNQLKTYNIFKDHTEFNIDGKTYKFNFLLPKEFFYSIQMTNTLLDYLKIKPDYSFFPRSGISLRETRFVLPPGRSNLFKGIKNTTIIDSSYNATPDSVRAILQMFDIYPSSNKWLVLGDMIELGREEKEEHEKLANMIASMKLEKVILVGPRVSKYTYPKLINNRTVKTFLMPKDALAYLDNNLKGEETILFKGARFLEGIIEHILLDKKDINKLCRREVVWQKRRKKWEL